MIPVWVQLSTLATEVIIVAFFLFYLMRRDREQTAMAKTWAAEAQLISGRCHDTQEAGHKALRELTTVIMTLNGKHKKEGGP